MKPSIFIAIALLACNVAQAQVSKNSGLSDYLDKTTKLGAAYPDTSANSFDLRRIIGDDTVGHDYRSLWEFQPGYFKLATWRNEGEKAFFNGGGWDLNSINSAQHIEVNAEENFILLSVKNEGESASANQIEAHWDGTYFSKPAKYGTDVSASYTTRSFVDKGYVSSTFQPLDADLTAIAALAPSTGNVIKWSGSAWTAAADAGAFTAGDNQLLYSSSNTPTGAAAFTVDPTNELQTITGNGATTNAVVNRLVLSTNTTGSVSNGLGSALLFRGESTTTENTDMGQVASFWSNATHGSRQSAMTFSTVNAGVLGEKVRITTDGRVAIGSTNPGTTLTNTTSTLADGITTSQSTNNTAIYWRSTGSGYVAGFEQGQIPGSGVLCKVPASTATTRVLTAVSGLGRVFMATGDGAVDMYWGRIFGSTPTQETNYFAANSSGTNVNVGIVPKGTGAIVARVPDGTSAGGNARGWNAIDLQINRSNATEVASGTESFLAGGQQNTASGTAAVVLGGLASLSSGGYALAQGYYSSAIGDRSFASGEYAVAGDYGQEARANGRFAEAGDAQVSRLVLRKQITGVSGSELFGNGTNSRVRVPTNRAVNARVQVVAVCKTVGNGSGINAGDTFVAEYAVGIKNNAETTALVGAAQSLFTAQSNTGMSTSMVSITADDTNDALSVVFTPPSTAGSTTVINTVATVTYTQSGF